MKTLCLLLLCASLAACDKTPAPATSGKTTGTPESRSRDEEAILMRAVFGKHYRAASGDALAELRDFGQRGGHSTYVVTAYGHTILPNGDTVLVANAEGAEDDGQANSGMATLGLLNVFFLRQNGAHWKVLKRHENIAEFGSNGHIGDVRWAMLAPGKPALAIEDYQFGNGYNRNALFIFDLADPSWHNLTDGIPIHTDNDGACDQTKNQCWNVSGAWHVAAPVGGAVYGDLLFKFSGQLSKAKDPGHEEDGADVERVNTTVHAKARYAFDGKHYRLVEGKNVVPSL
ncbi:hypothetical protein AAKU55_002807 [Oxalobacteraceae bacterium GrIS 1.11]